MAQSLIFSTYQELAVRTQHKFISIKKYKKNPTPKQNQRRQNSPFGILRIKLLDTLFFLLFKFFCSPPFVNIILFYHFSSTTSDCIWMKITQICILAVSDTEFLERQCLNAWFLVCILPTHLIGLIYSLVPL